MIVSAWASVHHQLAQLYVMATAQPHDEQPDLPEGYSFIPNRPAIAGFDALESLSTRIGAISAAISAKSQGVAEEFDSLAVKVRKSARSRNIVLHGSWAADSRYPNDVILSVSGFLHLTPSDEYVRYTPADFVAIANAAGKTSRAVAAFSGRLARAIRGIADG